MKNAERKTERIAHFSTDYAHMSPAARARLEEDLMRLYFTPHYQCMPFDPTELVALVKEQCPDQPELAEAFARCTEQWRKNNLYTYFMDPQAKERSRYAYGFFLECPRQGLLVVDVAESGAIQGIEHMKNVMRGEEHDIPLPPAMRIVHWK